ncbi:MAG TPA: hypothetical protein VFA33_26885 [Bryobacteraceae bacterium]|nr:hypothetical protein [Bryobacteraceae bacterium]
MRSRRSSPVRRLATPRSSRRLARKLAPPPAAFRFAPYLALGIVLAGYLAAQVHARYTFSLQWPVRVRFQWPLVVAVRTTTEEASEAQADQGRPLTAYQQYACRKFGAACRVALAIQRAENPRGACEIYHYNSDGTLDWGYFQINTVHLQRPGLNLRDLLDCRANIDFAYRLYEERGFAPWSTYNNGAYRRFLRDP